MNMFRRGTSGATPGGPDETPGGTPEGDTPGGPDNATPGKEGGAGGDGKAPEVGQMKPGDYMIHVFIEKAKQLKVPDGNTVDPLIEVSVLNEKKFTTAKDDISGTGQCSWNEHLFFEPKAVVSLIKVYLFADLREAGTRKDIDTLAR